MSKLVSLPEALHFREKSVGAPVSFVLDARQPRILDHGDDVIQIVSGHADVFVVSMSQGAEGAREHLFRAGPDEIVLGLQERRTAGEGENDAVKVIAVGGPGAEAILIPRSEHVRQDHIGRWIGRLAEAIAGQNPSWDIPQVLSDGDTELGVGERRRAPARDLVWLRVKAGELQLLGRPPNYGVDSPPVPLTRGMWVEGSDTGCTVVRALPPSDRTLWAAIDHFHVCAMAFIRERLARIATRDSELLARRHQLTAAQTSDIVSRLSGVIIRQPAIEGQSQLALGDPLLAACQLAADAIGTTVPTRPASNRGNQGLIAAVEIARAARLRARRTLLRGDWWRRDVGALVAWRGTDRDPVALVRTSGRSYRMIDPLSGTRRRLDRETALQLAPEAVSFYPALPSGSLRFRDLLTFSISHSRGNFARIALAAVLLGLLSVVPPLIMEALVDSVIPRTELDQLAFCAAALAVTTLAVAGMQAMEAIAMLRLEGLIDWKLQAALIDRVLRLPASVFREYTVGDFVDRAMAIDTVRRLFTGRTFRGLVAGSFCWFSIALMFYFDARLALVALALTLLRAILIIAASALRLYHETQHFRLQGKLEGLVLQLLAGIGKLRVAAATIRALNVWSKVFAEQKLQFTASQRIANGLVVFETSFPTIATLIIFAAASGSPSHLTLHVGAFLAFFTAFGQSIASVGAWASGISESLIAIPLLRRMQPIISCVAEVSDDRKPPGELSGAIEFSRVTFRYDSDGPPVLDNVSLRIEPGEYVAIVGPSGSGKSSLFRLLLGFERPESGTIFYDGKAVETLDVSAVRRQLGTVLQNGRLTTGSIYDNICGGLQLPLEQAWEAARLAGLDMDIRAMPMGMHTAMAEGVSTLSGGQRQRIMIARAIARRPRILLLDEATSSLDNQSQSTVSTSLGGLNVTRLVIAHRLTTVREADRIIVLVEGKVLQSGTFAELSQSPGLFSEFVRRQLI